MDILATQVYEDDSFTPTQQLSHSLLHNIKEKPAGILRIGIITYLIEQGITKIGRHPECDIILNDPTVSKKHAEIEVNEAETWICDLNSSNKTKLNSSVLRPGRYYELKGGSVVEFGRVRAVYSMFHAIDESFIPQTPAISHPSTKEMIIPVTPDSSMNCSSTSDDNVSIVPGTQAEKGDSIFRRPSLPVKSSVSKRKSYVPDSSSDDSMNDSRDSSALGKENLGENTVSTHDLETQNPFESQSNLSEDIHDVQTQNQTDIHNMETQHEENVETQQFITNIHDVETQHDIDIDNLNMPGKTEVQNTLVKDDERASAVEKGQTEEAQLKADVSMEVEKSEIKKEESCSNAVDRPEQAVPAKDENLSNSEQLKNDRRGSQYCLELSIATNFDDDCSEFNRSSSQNLLENLISDDDLTNESGSKSLSPLKSSANNNETAEKSSDEENIFDMATQANANNENVFERVTERIDYTFKASAMEDDSDDDTDQEGVFQRYSRIASQGSSQGTVLTKSQPDSEDSDTDQEGNFAAMAMKEKKMSLSLYDRKETKNNADSSRDSDDLFDVATQKVNLENSSKKQGDVSKASIDFNTPTHLIEANKPEDVVEKGSADFDIPTQVIEVSKPEDVTNKGSDDFDTPTQVIDTIQPVNVTEKGSVSFNKDEDDLMPTQILPIGENSRNVTAAAKGNTTRNEDKYEDETDYNTPTQIIAEKVPIYNDPPSSDSEQINPLLVEEFSTEDIDYEMAPTQLLSDIEEKKKAALANKKKNSGKFNRVNLDDTVERNLNEMFDDVNEDIEDDQPQMSTQVLTNMLESPQNKEEFADVNVDNELPGSSKEKTLPRRSRGKSAEATLEVSPSLSTRKSLRSSLKKAVTNDDSQNYFSNLTTKRKRNLLADSQELATMGEDKVDTEFEKQSKSNEKIKTKQPLNDENNVSAALLKSSPKNSPSTRFSRTNKPEDLKAPEPVIENAELVKGNKNVAVELDRGDEISITSVNAGQFERVITQDSDEDIMAGLPEVQILGTLSNPASPTSSTSTEFRFTTRNVKPKSGTKKTESKKKVLPKKSTRKSVARTNLENNQVPKVGRLRTSAISSSFDNFNISRVPGSIYESDNDIVNEIKPSNRTSSRKSKESGSLQIKPNFLCSEVRRSPSIQDNGRTRSSIKEYSSSVFQVGKEALVPTVAESVRKTAVKTSRAVKRSLSTTDIFESNDAKKRKENVTEKASAATKGRKTTRGVAATRSNSANILDYMTRRDSPVLNSDSSQQLVSSSYESFGTKELRIKIRRLSSNTPTPPPLLTPTRSVKEDDRSSVNSAISNSSKAENDKSTVVEEKVYLARGNRSKRAVSKRNVEDGSLQMVEEMQEVEMTMNSGVKEENGKQKETNESTIVEEKVRPTRGNRSTRAARKRNVEDDSSEMGEDSQEVEMIMNSWVKEGKVKQRATNGSTIVEEKVRPTRGSRSKRAASKRNVEDDNSEMEEEVQEVKMTMNSGVKEENGKQKETNESTIVEEKVRSARGNRSTRAARKRNVEDDSSEMEEEMQEVEMTMTSGVKEENVNQEEMNQSTKGARDRGKGARNTRSMNFSFATSTPTKIKHKILFTGITNDYSKLLTKLGCSQVEDPAKCTVLVTDKVRRTVKFLCALAQAVPIVSVSWLVDSEKAGRFTELDNYILKDPAAEAKFGFRLRGSLEKAKKQKLLDGYTIVLTPNVAPPPVQELKSIISSCGGKPLIRPPPSWPQNAVIISREEDMASAKKFLVKASKTVTIQSTEFILTGILRQELDFVKYKLM